MDKSKGKPHQSIPFILIVWRWIDLIQADIPLCVFLSSKYVWLVVDPEVYSGKNPDHKRAVRNLSYTRIVETHRLRFRNCLSSQLIERHRGRLGNNRE